MADRDDVTRRSVLKASAAAAGIGLAGTASASEDGGLAGAEQIPCVDVTDAREEDLEAVDAASVAPETSSGIGPGSFLLISRGGATAGCTANFVWDDGGDVYLGAAGHCFLPGDTPASKSAGGSFDATNQTVEVCIDCAFGGATGLNGITGGRLVELGEVIYARQSEDGVGPGSDFGLVRIPEAARDLIDPTMPKFGGPSEAGTLEAGETACHYGNAVAFGETFLTKGRSGAGLGSTDDVWRAATASAPGDSGAAVQTCNPSLTGLQGAQAVGALTHLTTNGVAGTTMSRAEEMAAEAGLDITPRLG
jgi:hypothetical protein